MSSDDELFEKMMNKNNNDNDDFISKMKKKTPKVNSDDETVARIQKSGYDYYKILGVDKTSNIDIIKKKYRHLLAKYHPDKLKLLSEDKRETKLQQYQLIRMAGEILTNIDKKKLYDLEQKTIRTNNFTGHKDSFEEFIKLQDSTITPENKNKALLEFRQHSEKLNKIRNYDPSNDSKLDKKSLDKNVQDLLSQRDIENIELSQKNIFDGRCFNSVEFNKMFEKNKKKEEKKLKKKQDAGELIKYDDKFTAFNDSIGTANFTSVNDDYGELFGKDEFADNHIFSKPKTNTSDVELSDSDISIDYDDDYNNHNTNKLKSNDLDSLLAKRQKEDFMYKPENINRQDFFKDVMHDEFGISKDFGVMIGDDMGTTRPRQITSEMAKVYNKMINYEDDDD